MIRRYHSKIALRTRGDRSIIIRHRVILTRLGKDAVPKATRDDVVWLLIVY